jgi:hypothetical protein
MKSRWVSILIVVVSLSSSSLSATFYVSPGGSDTNPGTTQGKAWKTLSRVNRWIFEPGSEILLEGGKTFEGSLVIDPRSKSSKESPITIGSYGKGPATIRVETESGIVVKNRSGIIVRDLVVKSPDRSRNNGTGVEILNDQPEAPAFEFVRISNVQVSGFKWAGIYVGGVPTDNPNTTAPKGCLYGFRDVVIEKCVARDNMYYGIHVSSPWKERIDGYGNAQVTIRDCVASDNPGDPTYTTNHSGSGIMLDDCDTGMIEYCAALRNGALNGSQTGGPIGIWAHYSTGITIQHCLSASNRTGGAADGGGFDLDGGVTHSIIQYCYSRDNDGAGYLVWDWGAAKELAFNTIRYSISDGDGRKHGYGSIHIGSNGRPIHDIDIVNNTLIAAPSRDEMPKCVWAGGKPNVRLRFFNNLFVSCCGVPLIDLEPQQDAIFHYNSYWMDKSPFLLRDGGLSFESLAAWQEAIGREMLGGKSTGLTANPRLTSYGIDDSITDPRKLTEIKSFRLRPNSPLLHAGRPIPEPLAPPAIYDFWKIPILKNFFPGIGASAAGRN